jgi:hypothetical protein
VTGQTCDLRWCDGPAGHDGSHRAHLGEVALASYNTAREIGVSVECGPAETVPLPVLAIGPVIVRLDWAQADALTGLLLNAARRYGS